MMPTPEGTFDFLEYSGRYKCMSRSLRYTLRKEPETKNNQPYGNHITDQNILFTKRVLKNVVTRKIVKLVLKCSCPICGPIARRTPPEEDDRLAIDVSEDVNYQMLFAALAFMGATFAIRGLDEHTCDTIDKALDRMPKLELLRENLFRPFESYINRCPHDGQHLVGRRHDSLKCLEKQFLAQLRAASWIVRVPFFKADNLLQRFGENHNMPFIDEEQLSNGAPVSDRKYYKFRIHEDYCDVKLKDRILFRKQLFMNSEKARREIDRESAILRYLKDVGNPNIAEVLFAFQEEHPPSFSLVFDFHPADLRQVLYNQTTNNLVSEMFRKAPNRFVGSSLDHWLWVGMLGIFDAVAAVHEPQRHTQAIPETQTSRLLGGHFDIKPANILIDGSGRFLLTDFGQAYFKKIKTGQEAHFTVGAQTQNYMPPPSLSELKIEGENGSDGKRWWTQAYDLWSLACVCIEVLVYIEEGDDAPTKFQDERIQEDHNGLANFWKNINGQDMVKSCVAAHLSSYTLKNGDEYLRKVASQVQRMFSTQRGNIVSVKACHQELSSSVEVDRYLFKSQNDVEIAGQGTYMCLEQMRTSFSNERVSQMRCSLYLWTNQFRKKTTLTLEFTGSGEQIMVTPCTTKNEKDEIIPISMFDASTIYEQNHFRTNEPFHQFAFRTMHDGITFHIAKRRDFNHFLGALTHQHVCTGSEFRLRACEVDIHSGFSSKTLKITNSETASSENSAHIQIWEDLRSENYAQRYTNRYVYRNVPIITTSGAVTPTSPTPDDRSSAHMSARQGKRPTGEDVVHFRLALYLKTSSAVALIVISLNYDTFYEILEEKSGRARMTLERRKGQKKIFAAVYEHKILPPDSFSDSPQVQSYPGIPLDPTILSQDIEKHSGLRRVKMDFWGKDGLEDFGKHYRRLRV